MLSDAEKEKIFKTGFWAGVFVGMIAMSFIVAIILVADVVM